MSLASLASIGCSVLLLACSSAAAPGQQVEGFDAQALQAAIDSAGRVPGMRSLLVARHGQLVSESYFNGIGPDSTHDVRSVTKSVTSTLVGIAIREGFIEGTEASLGDLLPSAAPGMSPEWAEVTLDDLMTMRAGHRWSEIPGPSEFNAFASAPDQLDYILAKQVLDPPGSIFNYSDGSAHLVSAALAEATGMAVEDFARDYLFEPMGLEAREWATDNRGYAYGGVGLYLTGRDMIALGQLFLDGGTVDGVQVVPADWVETATQSHTSTGNAVPYGPSYGYFWWRGQIQGRDFFFANGYGGQFIVVVPSLDLVVTAGCRWWQTGGIAPENWYRIITLIMTQVIPSAR